MLLKYLHTLIVMLYAFSYMVLGVFYIPFGKAGEFYRNASYNFGKRILKLAGVTPSWEGLEKLEKGQSYVFVGNHQSYFDIFLILAALGSCNMRTLFMIKKELFRIPLFKTVADHMGLIAVDREQSKSAMQAMMEAIKKVQSGFSLTIFPEGTRSAAGELNEFKRGAFMLADKAGMPIVPFVITGTINIFPRKPPAITPGRCDITFLEPIQAGEYRSRELAEVVEQRITETYAVKKMAMDELWQK